MTLAHPLLGSSVSLLEAPTCSTPRAFQPMTIPQAHNRIHSHHSIATAVSMTLNIVRKNSSCRIARAALKRMTPAETIPRQVTPSHPRDRANTLTPGILTLPLRTFWILNGYAAGVVIRLCFLLSPCVVCCCQPSCCCSSQHRGQQTLSASCCCSKSLVVL